MSEPPLLQPDRVQELYDDFGDETADVVGEFVAETDREVAVILGLLAAPTVDVAAVQGTAHKLKGGCMMVGAAALQRVATELDALGKAGAPPADLAGRARVLEDVWARTRQALRSHV